MPDYERAEAIANVSARTPGTFMFPPTIHVQRTIVNLRRRRP
jgi:hypothetical protein